MGNDDRNITSEVEAVLDEYVRPSLLKWKLYWTNMCARSWPGTAGI